MIAIDEIPVFILCGGMGTRLKEETEFRPKPMVPIGKDPILLHIMQYYGSFGFRRFVLCLGYKAEVIRQYFVNYSAMKSDVTVHLGTGNLSVHERNVAEDWEVTLADTGERTMTGARVARAAERYLGEAEHFAVTYGDGLTDADLGREFQTHVSGGKLGTILGVHPPSRFGEIKLKGDTVACFDEKPELSAEWINGGYAFFRRGFLPYLSTEESCVLEQQPLAELARDGQMSLYRHEGFWACMDTQRDRDYLEGIFLTGKAPWVRSSDGC